MTGDASEARRAALLLHALGEGDRAWLLEQLSEGERTPLVAMLSELRTLGIPPESTLLAQAARSAGPPDDGAGEPRADSAMETAGDLVSVESPADIVRRAAPQQMAQILRCEPAALIAALLALELWPWREAMLAQLGVVKRREVEDAALTQPSCAPLLGERMIGLLAQRLKDAAAAGDLRQPVRAASPAAPRKWDRLVRHLAFALRLHNPRGRA